MKRIGLLGGTSWPSTIEYYRLLNESAARHFGEGHSAKLLLWSIDYFDIKQHAAKDYLKVHAVLKRELEALDALNPACIVICNNTLHESYDAIKDQLTLNAPVIHMAELTAEYVSNNQCRRVLLTGTQYTMECGYYAQKLVAQGINVTIPDLTERQIIQSIIQAIVKGKSTEEDKLVLRELLLNYDDCDSVITACTELPLILTQEITSLKVIDPLQIQCDAAFNFSIT